MASNGLLHYKNVTLDRVLQDTHRPRLTKIICTIGPSCSSVETLIQLFDAGLNICRLNFSHGDHESHHATVANINAAREKRPELNISILLDTKGPEIRTGLLAAEYKKAGLQISTGQTLTFVPDYTFLGGPEAGAKHGCDFVVACSYAKLSSTVDKGDKILCADGSIVFEVLSCTGETVKVKCMNSGSLGERKNMNLPGNKVDLPTITEKDVGDLKAFAKDIDFVAASFVQHGSDYDDVKNALGNDGKHVKVIAKIENQEGLHNFPSILERFDAIMVARGDLGMEIPIEKVFLAQKYLIRQCNVYGKPVVTATQMLESMTKNPRPTRAESTDVANAVLDGTDAVMLSGETANGAFPVESCDTLSRICKEAESVINHEKLFSALVNSMKHEFNIQASGEDRDIETIASSVVKAKIDAGCNLIIVISENTIAAQRVAKYRPGCPILVLTGKAQMARQLSGIVCAVFVHSVDRKQTVEAVLQTGFKIGIEKGWIKPGESVVVLKRVKRKENFKHLMELNVVPEEE